MPADELNELVGGELLNTHRKDECLGPYCTVHNNSDHHMVTWKQTWDFRVGRIMRICLHNVAHPDPDEINSNREHVCDTCCDPASQFQIDAIELTKDYIKPDYLTPTSLGVSLGGHRVGPAVTPPEEWVISPGTGYTGASGGGVHTHSTAVGPATAERLAQLEKLVKDISKRKHRGVDFKA